MLDAFSDTIRPMLDLQNYILYIYDMGCLSTSVAFAVSARSNFHVVEALCCVGSMNETKVLSTERSK